jgi:predicted NAD-dependent protein-ADP-ribosyltransferase YbiA (DUF1768 family)
MPSFRDELHFLSNMYPCNIFNVYKSSEHLYQASLAANTEAHNLIVATPDGYAAKRLAHKLPRRLDVDQVKVPFMAHALYLKFLYNPDIRAKLIWHKAVIIEENEWHDNFWGMCTCNGCANKVHQNKLGKLLTITRDYFINIQNV